MKTRLILLLVTATVLPFLGCQSKTKSTKSNSGEEPQTKLFLNIVVPKIGKDLHPHFSDVDSHGSQAKSEPGSAGGFMAMNGRKFQRFQISGAITENERTKLYSELKTELRAIIEAQGARIIGEINERVRDRPIWYLSMILPSASKVDLENLEGFYIEYADDSGNGFIDVMATRESKDGENETWRFGFAIHEPYDSN